MDIQMVQQTLDEAAIAIAQQVRLVPTAVQVTV
jgi:hypothetical protein